MSKRTKHRKIIIGDTFRTNEGYDVIVISTLGSFSTTVEFACTKQRVTTTAQNIRNGQIKNVFHKTTFGIGFLGEGHHPARLNGVDTDAYVTWRSMMTRAYCVKYHARFPTYKGCTVAENWHNYQIFAEWYINQQKPNDFVLDKDLTVEGNKIYSSEYCALIPEVINLLMNTQYKNNGLPRGVRKRKNMYEARVSIAGKHVQLGSFPTPDSAFNVYKVAKEENIKNMANEHRCVLPYVVYKNLMSYTVLPS